MGPIVGNRFTGDGPIALSAFLLCIPDTNLTSRRLEKIKDRLAGFLTSCKSMICIEISAFPPDSWYLLRRTSVSAMPWLGIGNAVPVSAMPWVLVSAMPWLCG